LGVLCYINSCVKVRIIYFNHNLLNNFKVLLTVEAMTFLTKSRQ
jgi:hypothetical protein